jgi:hypothetical protein
MTDNTITWLMDTKFETGLLAEAYRLRLVGRLWWANLMLVVIPAACATAAAAFAAHAQGATDGVWAFAAAILAGSAAVLTAVHKALRCEEYQTECLRLSRTYENLRVRADAHLCGAQPEDKIYELAESYAAATTGANALLPNAYIRKARKRIDRGEYAGLPRRPRSSGDNTPAAASIAHVAPGGT